MRIRLLLTGVLSLCLLACGASRGSGVKPENEALPTDLKVLVLGVRALTEPRPIAGALQRIEDATTVGQAFDFGMDAEEGHGLSELDKVRTRNFVESAALEIARGRLPECRWWQRARDGICRR